MNKPIELVQVKSVYTGKPGQCCCGCSGIHRYTEANREWASKNRGYTVTDDEINERHVKKVVGIINANIVDAIVDINNVSVEINGRLFVAYTN
jgi:hypothetical protein